MIPFKEKNINPMLVSLARMIDQTAAMEDHGAKVVKLDELRSSLSLRFALWSERERTRAGYWGLLVLAGAATVIGAPVGTVAVLTVGALLGTAGALLAMNGLYRSRLVVELGLRVDEKLRAEILAAEHVDNGKTPDKDLTPAYTKDVRASFAKYVAGAEAQPGSHQPGVFDGRSAAKPKSGVASRLELKGEAS